MKRGEHGALYFDAEGVFAAPAMPLAVEVDPTGAGDTFAGGLCGYLATQRDLDHQAMRRAMVHGTAAASFCVQTLGTTGVARLTATELTDRVGEIQRLYNISDDEWSRLPRGPYRTGEAT